MPLEIKRKRKRATKFPWDEIKDTWILSHLDGRPLTHVQLAEKYGSSVFAISSRSSKYKWADELKIKSQEKADFLAGQLRGASELAIAGVQQELATNEIAVRTKHATISRALQARAMKVLTSIDLKQITAKDALLMLKIGLEEERKALGLPDVFVRTENNNTTHPEYKPLVQQFDQHREVQAMGIELLKRLKMRQGAITNATILSEVGLDDLEHQDKARAELAGDDDETADQESAD